MGRGRIALIIVRLAECKWRICTQASEYLSGMRTHAKLTRETPPFKKKLFSTHSLSIIAAETKMVSDGRAAAGARVDTRKVMWI